jgi:hypothetical protein
MLRKSTIQNARYCRSRAYGVFSTYSLRGYYKNNPREVDREKSFLGYLEERGETSIFRNRCRSRSPHFGALNPSLSLDFDGGRRKSPRGDVRERGEATGVRGRLVNAAKGERMS